MEMNRRPFSEFNVSEPVEQLSKFLPFFFSEKLISTLCATPATLAWGSSLPVRGRHCNVLIPLVISGVVG
jgi:hypothetical protein